MIEATWAPRAHVAQLTQTTQTLPRNPDGIPGLLRAYIRGGPPGIYPCVPPHSSQIYASLARPLPANLRPRRQGSRLGVLSRHPSAGRLRANNVGLIPTAPSPSSPSARLALCLRAVKGGRGQ